jgi:glycosyltransferase involved in cell wall biosynthesis
MARLLEVLAGAGFDVTAVAGSDASLESHLESDGARYSAAVLSRPATAERWLPVVRRHAPDALLVYDTLDLHYVREFRRAKHTRSSGLLAQALERKRQELALVAGADRTLVVSAVEREMLLAELPDAEIHVVSNIHPVSTDPPPFDARAGVVFVGAFEHEPNLDAARWLVDELWPLMRSTGGRDIELTIVGRHAPAWLADAAGITVAASVPDVAPYIDAARLSVAPLRFGAGVKGKVLESLGRGTPVVGTAIAFEGIDIDDGACADDAAGLARTIVALHDDRTAWHRLQREGLRVVADSFSPAAAERALTAALRREAVRV